MTDRTTALNSGSSALSEGFSIRTASPAGCLKSLYKIASARPDSPGPDVSNTMLFIGDTKLISEQHHREG